MPSSARSTDGASHVVLVGMMGSGKTTVGRLLAERLGRPFVDSDEQVEARTGRTVREIFESSGERAFRRFEAEALRRALGTSEPAVIAAAGGVVLDAANRELLARRRAFVVWLRADPAVLAVRAASGDHRPLLGDDPEAALTNMEDRRAPLYEEVADAQVDVGALEPGEVADAIEGMVGARGTA